MPILYLIPLPLGEGGEDYLPELNAQITQGLNHFIVERARTARRFIRSVLPDFSFDGVEIIEMNKHDFTETTGEFIKLCDQGADIGLMSEAGLPCVADPGARIVTLARERGYIIRPLSGPGSVYLSLMASGLNGQAFIFHGYLPIKPHLLKIKLRDIDQMLERENMTHIFIETPYRNDSLLKMMTQVIHPDRRLCVAINVSLKDEKISTMAVKAWKHEELGKTPAIFLLGK